jgi:hypothetical protein
VTEGSSLLSVPPASAEERILALTMSFGMYKKFGKAVIAGEVAVLGGKDAGLPHVAGCRR